MTTRSLAGLAASGFLTGIATSILCLLPERFFIKISTLCKNQHPVSTPREVFIKISTMCKNHNQNQYPVSTPREVFIKITEIEAKAAKALVSYHPKLAAHMIKTSQYQVCHTEQEPAICHEEQKEKTVGFVRGAVIVNYSTMMIN